MHIQLDILGLGWLGLVGLGLIWHLQRNNLTQVNLDWVCVFECRIELEFWIE